MKSAANKQCPPAAPQQFDFLRELCKRAWTIMDISYPWYSCKYGDNQACWTEDGFIQLRLQVLDHTNFDRFRIMNTQEAEGQWPLRTVQVKIAQRICGALNVPVPEWSGFWIPETNNIVGQELDMKQLTHVIVCTQAQEKFRCTL